MSRLECEHPTFLIRGERADRLRNRDDDDDDDDDDVYLT